MGMCGEKKIMNDWMKKCVWSMKWRDSDQEVEQRGLERGCASMSIK